MLTPTTAAAAARFASLGSRALHIQTTFARGANCPFSSPASPFIALARKPCTATRVPSRPISTKITFHSSAPRRQPTPPLLQSRLAGGRRHASTTTSTSSPEPSDTPKLDWNHFFQLRKTRRRFQLASSIVTMTIGGTGGALLLVNMNMDWLLSKAPVDPIFALGIITLSFAGLGWLSGPSLGSAIFYSLKRGVKRPMALKESEFFNRIKKNRVDPSNSSLSGNAVPDFYGEKISSVAGYRQWLKDQRAFNKKRTSFV
ncbi:Pam17-domain-containing protein [Hypoxylon argillaceum]|nr:Pam17-domain-containing protein [Hypoxylon argillaceum]